MIEENLDEECTCDQNHDPHSCPYDEEIHKVEKLCTCCLYCTYQCRMNV